MRILIVEDDEVLSDSLVRAMTAAGYVAEHAVDGVVAAGMLACCQYDLVILDINLPRLDGLQVLQGARAARQTMPVILLTARDAVEDRIRGLDAGADDYLAKPFSLAELEARVRALLRRGQSGGSRELCCGPLRLDTVGRRVTLQGQNVEFSARELSVLEFMLYRQGRVVSKEQLIESLYRLDEEITPNAIEVYVHRLRKKLEPGGVHIRTVRGLGYLMEYREP